MPPLSCSAAEVRDEADALTGLAHLKPRASGQTPTLVILNCNGEQFGFKIWRVKHQCCSLQMIFICGLVTGGKEFPQGDLLDMLLAVSGHYRPTLVGNHCFLPGAGYCWSREPHFSDIGWEKVSMDGSWPKPLGLDICGRHGRILG